MTRRFSPERRRIGRRRVQEDEIGRAQYLDGVVDLVQVAHPGREDDRSPCLAWYLSRRSSVRHADATL